LLLKCGVCHPEIGACYPVNVDNIYMYEMKNGRWFDTTLEKKLPFHAFIY